MSKDAEGKYSNVTHVIALLRIIELYESYNSTQVSQCMRGYLEDFKPLAAEADCPADVPDLALITLLNIMKTWPQARIAELLRRRLTVDPYRKTVN